MRKPKTLLKRVDRLALGDYLAECGRRGEPVPANHPALSWFEDGWVRYRRGADLSDALFGARLDGGRHADPRRREVEQRRYEDVHAAVRAAVHCGHHGEEKLEVGAQIFNDLHSPSSLTPNQVNRVYELQNVRINKGQARSFLTPQSENLLLCSGHYAQQLQREPYPR
jgi:hypothetical protein